jgi:putative acetyltransferase
MAGVQSPSHFRLTTSRKRSLINITEASTPLQLDAVRKLMRSFIAWHRGRHVQDLQLIDEYFDAAAFDEELRTLPGEYSRPRGSLLFATVQQQPAGCVALRAIDADYCEMKRMFVYAHFRGRGAGLALATRIIDNAREAGYRAMRLDTSIRQAEAKDLYSRLGFRIIEPYYELPQKMRDWLVFMELEL